MRKKKFARSIGLVIVLLLVMAGHSLAEEFGWPLPGHTYITATYTYPSSGSRHSCRYSTPDGRAAGIDIGVDIGTEVYAPASGTVQKMSWQYPGFGNHFEILHDDGTITLYAHLSEYRVQNGQRVNRGDLIALTGNTGGDYGAHLHYEMKDIDGYQYYQTNGYRDPRTMSDKKSTPKYSVNPGLTGLTSSRYAKTYTLTSGHYKVYTNSDLTAEDSSHWTGYDEEDYIIGVGFNSSGEAYAQVQIPTDSGSRLTVYVSLHDVFVPGTLTESGTAVNKSGGLYKRKNDAYHSDWWIDPGDTVYLLTEDSGFCQVMYPISGYSYWRIAWLTRSDYDYVMGKGSTPSGDDTNARDKVVAYAWEIYNFKWYAFQPILRHQGEYLGPMWIRGIPYTLYGTGDTFEQYKKLVDNDNSDLYETTTYYVSWLGENRTSMKHGMACATFVTTCIMQGFPNDAGLSMQPATEFHTKDGWRNYVTQGNKDYSGYAKLQKGDYLDNYKHVILVVGNHVGSGNSDSYIEYVDQTPTYVEDNDVGTHKGTYYYSTLSSSGYRPMYVKYPGDSGSDSDPTSDEIPIDSAHFPDDLFREYVSFWDSNQDGYFSDEEIDNVTDFGDYGGPHPDNEYPTTWTGYEPKGVLESRIGKDHWKGIKSIEGVKIFRDLEVLYVHNDSITGTVDISGLTKLKDFRCFNDNGTGGITQIKADGCTALERIECRGNSLAYLNIDGCNSLSYIDIYAPKITTESLPDLYYGEEYNAKIATSGMRPVTYTAWGTEARQCGFLLDGQPLYASNTSTNGIINGTVNSNPVGARYTYSVEITVSVKNEWGTDEKTFTVKMMERAVAPTITTTSLLDGWTNEAYSATITATGTAPITYSASGLPGGLSCSSEGKISGTPQTAGTYTVTLKASNIAGNAPSKSINLTIKTPPTITTSATLPEATTGSPYSITISASGTKPITWAKTGGTLPSEMTLSNTGVLSGTPSSSGTYNFTVKASNGKDASRTFTLKVNAKPSISGSFNNGIRKAKYSGYVEVSGGVAPFSWSVTGSVPPDTKFTYSGIRATLSGTPTKAGSFTFTLNVSDKNGVSASRTFTLKVTQTTVTGSLPAATTRRVSYTGTPQASGGASPYTWSISAGKLPDGLKINASTGKITGTASKAGTFNFTVKAKDKNGAAGSKAYTVKVTQTAVKGDIPTTITRKASYTGTPKATGGAGAYTWSISAGKLPDGLKINASTGKITGTASKAGTFNFTVKAKDKNGAAGSKAYTVKVTQTAVKGDIPTTITRRASYTGTPKATGGAGAYTWSISAGKLPDGLKINSKTGKITGTATKAGTFSFTVKAKDKNGAAATKKFTVKVTQTKVTGTIPGATKGSSYTATPKASGGASPYTWSISAGKLPNGLKFNSKTGKITGNPSKAGTFTFTVKAKDKNGAAGTKQYTLKVTDTTTKSATPDTKPDTKNDSATSTQGHNTASALPVTPEPTPAPEDHTAVAHTPSIRVISDDILEAHEDRDNDIFTVKAGQTLTFILDGKISGAIVYIDDEPIEGITISDEGTFTLPAEFVSGDFKVQVKSSDGKIESQEAFIISE